MFQTPEPDKRRDDASNLLPPELRETLPRLYAQEGERDPTVYVKFFSPLSDWTWYATEGQEEDGDFLFFGYVQGFDGEWGYFSLSELEGSGGMVERDTSFRPKPFSQALGQTP